jgi:hypothetical protein
VLDYAVELIVDGRNLERPVNYVLVRSSRRRQSGSIRAPAVRHRRSARRTRPGIGGFKADSEIGVALKAGHPCYFVGFLPEPMPGQTIEGRRARRGGVPREGHRLASASRRQALCRRQLPGGMGGS